MSASVAKAGGAVPACTIGHALHALDFLEHPCLTAQVKSLHLSLTLISTFDKFEDSYEMAELPPELVKRIFEAVRESEPPGYGTIDFPDAYYRFFDNASLVCKTWNELVKPFRTTYTISGYVPYGQPVRFARNGQQLVRSVPAVNVHIEGTEGFQGNFRDMLQPVTLSLSYRLKGIFFGRLDVNSL
jgi:hypothetical protein